MTTNGIQCGNCNGEHAATMREKFLKRVDIDGDGKITDDELASFLSRSKSKASVSEIFKILDANEDGAVTESELVQVFQKFDQCAEQVVQPRSTAAEEPNRFDPQTLMLAMRDTKGYDHRGAPIPVNTEPPRPIFSAVA